MRRRSRPRPASTRRSSRRTWPVARPGCASLFRTTGRCTAWRTSGRFRWTGESARRTFEGDGVDFDLIVRNATVGDAVTDVAVAGETIAALGADLSGTARVELDATGLHLFPGGIDVHVHADEPGRTEWEGF